MICFSCGFKVHDNHAKECQLCGAKFGSSCTACGAPNPPMAKYCLYCGRPLHFLDTGSTVQNFSSLNEGRRNVAVIFADISGFTSLSEKLDPEVVREIINECFYFVTRPVYEMGGIIDKYIGDCVMILFGAQQVHADDVRRAVICSMKMMSLIKEFSEERTKALGFSLDLSIGIHYGLVVTGSVGNYFDKDYTVMGDTVNTAQRIQTHTPKGTIYVSETVYKETKNSIEYTEPVELTVKNKENVLKCYIPLRISREQSRDISPASMVGRDKEILCIYNAWNETLSRSGKVIGVLGPGGIGKTRLVDEFVMRFNDPIKVLKVECNQSSSTKPYFLFGNLLMNIMNISPGDNMEVRKSRIISYVDYVLGSMEDETKKRNYEFLGLIMGVEIDGEMKAILAAMDTQSIRREMISQIQLFFRAYAHKYKAIIILEDIHWADPQSLFLLRELFKGYDYRNVMFVYTSRVEPEGFAPDRDAGHIVIQLAPLTMKYIERIAAEIVGCRTIQKEFTDCLVRFCGGNPLYLHEFLQFMKNNSLYHIEEDKALMNADSVRDIPQSLQSLILSRINDMDEKLAEIIRIASIIGKDFPVSVISYLLKRDIEDTREMHMLLRTDLISLKTVYAVAGRLEKVYTFRQEAEREVIYNSLLFKEKKKLHKRIGETMELLYQRMLDNFYEVLGDHFFRAEEYEKAAEYYYYSALKYKGLYNFQEALQYLKKTVEVGSLAKNSLTRERMFSIYREMGEVYIGMAKYDLAMERIQDAMKLSSGKQQLFSLKIMMARICKEQGRYEEAMRILRMLQPKVVQNDEYYGTVLMMKSAIMRAKGQKEEALRIARKAEKTLGRIKDYESMKSVRWALGKIPTKVHWQKNRVKYN